MTLDKAKAYVYRLLKFRLRSEKEIVERLKAKNFDEYTIKQAISFFKELGLLDDLKFSQLWVEERLKKPLGLSRIKKELRQKGIPEEVAEQVLQAKLDDYNEEEVISRILKEKVKKIKMPLSLKDKRRLYNWFIRRGFDIDKVYDLINSL